LIESCWDKSPAKRSSFQKIISKLDGIIVDAAIDDVAACGVWKNKFGSKDEVLWKDFLEGFSNCFVLPKNFQDDENVEHKALKYLLAQKSRDKSLKVPPDVVRIDKFGEILKFYGPADHTFVHNVVEILKRPDFYGDLSTAEAENYLNSKTERKGAYVIRLSSQLGNFTISKLGSQGIIHNRIQYKPGKGYSTKFMTKKGAPKSYTDVPSFAGLIEHLKSDMQLTKPISNPQSPYQHIFAKKNAKVTPGSYGNMVL
jgi:hypothetical protein